MLVVKKKSYTAMALKRVPKLKYRRSQSHPMVSVRRWRSPQPAKPHSVSYYPIMKFSSRHASAARDFLFPAMALEMADFNWKKQTSGGGGAELVSTSHRDLD